MVYEEMSIREIVEYINGELLQGRTMREIEEEDFKVNERLITKRLARKNIKKINGQFVLQSGSNVNTINKKQVIDPIREIKNNNFEEEKRFKELEKRVLDLEKILKEIVCTQLKWLQMI